MKQNSQVADLFFKAHPQEEGLSEIILIAENLSTPENVGALIRLAGNFGMQKVYFIGENKFKHSRIKKTASTAIDKTDWNFMPLEKVVENIPTDYCIRALEFAAQSHPISHLTAVRKQALIVGSESQGVSSKLLALADEIYHIPMFGCCKSMNVSHAVSCYMGCLLGFQATAKLLDTKF